MHSMLFMCDVNVVKLRQEHLNPSLYARKVNNNPVSVELFIFIKVSDIPLENHVH